MRFANYIPENQRKLKAKWTVGEEFQKGVASSLEQIFKENKMLRCPKCKSPNISQYRSPTGPIWCKDCSYRVEHKEIDKSFVVRDEPDELPKWTRHNTDGWELYYNNSVSDRRRTGIVFPYGKHKEADKMCKMLIKSGATYSAK
jgi:hypothetical protein